MDVGEDSVNENVEKVIKSGMGSRAEVLMLDLFPVSFNEHGGSQNGDFGIQSVSPELPRSRSAYQFIQRYTQTCLKLRLLQYSYTSLIITIDFLLCSAATMLG